LKKRRLGPSGIERTVRRIHRKNTDGRQRRRMSGLAAGLSNSFVLLFRIQQYSLVPRCW